MYLYFFSFLVSRRRRLRFVLFVVVNADRIIYSKGEKQKKSNERRRDRRKEMKEKKSLKHFFKTHSHANIRNNNNSGTLEKEYDQIKSLTRWIFTATLWLQTVQLEVRHKQKARR